MMLRIHHMGHSIESKQRPRTHRGMASTIVHVNDILKRGPRRNRKAERKRQAESRRSLRVVLAMAMKQ